MEKPGRNRKAEIKIGLLGCGTIGSGVFHLAVKNKRAIEESAGRPVRVSKILVKDFDEPRPFPADESIMVTDPGGILEDPDIDIFVEVMGGIEPAKSFALRILNRGSNLVTANKDLIATFGPELIEAASKTGARFKFEASVGGGIPLIRPLEESLGGDNILKIMGIMNGTTNYILTRMSSEGITYEDALMEAQKLGYTESNPESDVAGTDAAHKTAILSSIAFKKGVTQDQVYREGIQSIRPEDLENARELGYSVKLLAITECDGGGIYARVHPTMIPLDHPLTSVSGNFNAVFVIGESVGELMFYGQGAGSLPTATAILGDVVNIAGELGTPLASNRDYWLRPADVRSIGDVMTKFYMVLKVVDRPGVLAKIAGVFGDNDVSLESVVQKGIGDSSEIVLITHVVRDENFRRAREGLENLEVVLEIPSVIRVEGETAASH
ncbi:MAG: homoserine dehydrogenase [Actinobacteria bacterium]|nr:homoserine dehydrogenase [Actinomycetota bacterium]